jgi:hypothetical protein
MPGRIGVCPRNDIKKNREVSIGEAACGIPRGPGVSIDVGSRTPTACPEGNRVLAAIRDSRCGSTASPGHA